MTRHVCASCIKLKVCDWKCLSQCKKEYEKRINKEAEKEKTMTMYEKGLKIC